MRFKGSDHTFVLCAYKESAFLEQCILSLKNQTIKSYIKLCTSTPNKHIEELAKKYELPLFINKAKPGIATDWNYAISKAGTKLVTVAHQDDIYDENYLEEVLKAANATKNPILIHTAYYEIRNGEKVFNNKLLRIKKMLLFPFKTKLTWNSKFLRRRSLSMGSAICCPSVTYVRNRFPRDIFNTGYKANLDWQAWEKYSQLDGAFCYVSKPVMGHRIHEESETSNVIGDGTGRSAEDLAMFECFWPKPIAKLINKFYAGGQKSNSV